MVAGMMDNIAARVRLVRFIRGDLLVGNQCFLFFSSLLASCSPVRQTSVDVSERRHCWNALQTASESAGSQSICFLQLKMNRVESNVPASMILRISAPQKV